MEKRKKKKTELGFAIFMSLASTALAIYYAYALITYESSTINIISLIIWVLSMGGWGVKSVQDYRKLKELQ